MSEKSFIQRQREKRASFEARKEASGRTREEQREVDNSNSPKAVQERREAATKERADRLRGKGASQAAVDATGANERVTITQPARDSQGRTATDRAQAINAQRSSAQAVIAQSLAQSRERTQQNPVLEPRVRQEQTGMFGGGVIESTAARNLRVARAQQSQELTPLGKLFASTNLVRKATPQEVVEGKGVSEGDIVKKLVVTGALSDTTTPVVRIGSTALSRIDPSSFRGATQTKKASSGTKTFTLREFEGVVSDVKGVKKPASVLEIKVDQSGLVFREEKVGRKTLKSVFTERDLLLVEKPGRSGRTLRAGVREETDILANELRTVSFDETIINPSTGRVRTGGGASIVSEQRLTTSLGASRRGSLLLKPQEPVKPDLSGLRFVPDNPQFVRPPALKPQLDSPAFADRIAGSGNLITGVVRGSAVETPVVSPSFQVGESSLRNTIPRNVNLPSDTIQPFQVRELPAQKPVFNPVQRSGSGSGQRLKPVQRPVQENPPLQIPRPVLTTPTKQRFRTPTPTPLRSRIPEPLFQQINLRPRISNKPKPQGFQAFVRVGGTFKRVGPVLSRQDALEFGARKVSQTPAASFKIQSAGRGVETTLGLKGFFKGFERSKRDEDVFVEPSRLRINTPGELRGITFKGIKASRFKKIL